jgi:D-alanine-D-alanine ligase
MDNSFEGLTQKLNAAIEFVKQRNNDILLILVVTIKDSDTYLSQYDYTTEYFSADELSDYIDALESLGVLRDVSYGEDDFVQKLSNGYFKKFHQKYKIVFNTTGSRRIRSRSALIPALCELHHLPYASSDILTCAILENKVQCNNLLAYHNFPVPQMWLFDPRIGWMGSKPPCGIKLIAKPCRESASIGITQQSVGFFSKQYEQQVIKVSRILNEPVIVQEFIDGWEVEVPVLLIDGPTALPPMGINLDGTSFLNERFLSYELVYNDNYHYFRFDSIDSDLSKTLMEVAEKSFLALDLYGTVRVDFRIKGNKLYYITDYNNSPHLTRFHSVASSLSSLRFKYPDLFCLIIYHSIAES